MGDTYCAYHDIFNCPFAHDAGNKRGPRPIEELGIKPEQVIDPSLVVKEQDEDG